jgi:hypothetical protein
MGYLAGDLGEEVKGSWPKVTAAVYRSFEASHSLPGIGVSEPHSHLYKIKAGYRHEINPTLNGCTKPLEEMLRDLDGCIAKMEGKYLNDVLPFHPTAEIMAWTVLFGIGNTDLRATSFWQFIEVEAYDCFSARADIADARSEWREKFEFRCP